MQWCQPVFSIRNTNIFVASTPTWHRCIVNPFLVCELYLVDPGAFETVTLCVTTVWLSVATVPHDVAAFSRDGVPFLHLAINSHEDTLEMARAP